MTQGSLDDERHGRQPVRRVMLGGAERSAAKLAEAARAAEEDAAQTAALAAAKQARDAERVEEAAREVALEAERKAARDKRYAARKARQR
jgi:hypothetical protein